MSGRSSDVEGRVMTGTTVSGVGDADEVELARMGYKQELKYVPDLPKRILIDTETHFPIDVISACYRCARNQEDVIQSVGLLINFSRSLFQNFGVSFSIISVITGIPSLFLFGLVSFVHSLRGSRGSTYTEYWWTGCDGMGMDCSW